MDYYEGLYGVDFDKVSDGAAYEALTPDEKELIDKAWAEFAKDDEAIKAYNLMWQTITINATVGILLAFLLLEFAVPMIFKNGQTVGKKVFGIGVMRTDGVKIDGRLLFIRAILGKYTVETMIPGLMVVWIMTGRAGITAVAVGLLVIVGNLIMMAITHTNSGLHDLLAQTVTVDMASQMIFDSPEALLEYKQKVHAEAAERAKYY